MRRVVAIYYFPPQVSNWGDPALVGLAGLAVLAADSFEVRTTTDAARTTDADRQRARTCVRFGVVWELRAGSRSRSLYRSERISVAIMRKVCENRKRVL